MPSPAHLLKRLFTGLRGETVWKLSAGVIVPYPPHHGEQEIPYGPVRRRMALHQPASSLSHKTRTSQASQLTGDPGRRLLPPQERSPLAVAAEGLPALEDRL